MKIQTITNWHPFKATLILICLVIFSLSSQQAQASHAMGTELTYECLGNNVYEFTLSFYRDCDGVNAPTSAMINIGSISCGFSTTLQLAQVGTAIDISPLCSSALSSCVGGPNPGAEQYIYTGTFTLPQNCNDWVFSFSHCCRNSDITNLVNAASENIYIESTLDNTGGLCNSSPTFTTLPVPYLCADQLVNYNFGTYDSDGDSLVYSLVNALGYTGGADTLVYVAGYSPTYPITTDSGFVDFDNLSGSLTFTPDTQQVCVVTCLVEEYRNGELIGSIMRDIQVLVLDCPNNNIPYLSTPLISNLSTTSTQIDDNSIEVCAGNTVSFDLMAVELDTLDTITMSTNLSTSIPGASFTTSGFNPVTGSFSWTPTIADAGLNSFTVTVEDNACPIIGKQTYSFDIVVFPSTSAGQDIILCNGDSVQLNASGGTSFSWSPATGLSDTAIANPVAYPTTTTTYVVTADSACSPNWDSITVFVVPDFGLTVGADTTICFGDNALLTSVVTPAGTYSYSWDPASSVDSTGSPNPLANPTSTTTYTLNVTSVDGCVNSKQVTVNVNDLPMLALTGTDVTCPGGTDGTADVAASGTGPFTYLWDDPASQTTANATGLTIGSYGVMVTDGNGCSNSDSIDLILTNDIIVNISPSDTTICHGESVQLEVETSGTGNVTGDSIVPGSHQSSYTASFTRGYWFQAQSSYTITGLKASDGNTGGAFATNQSVAIVDFGTTMPQYTLTLGATGNFGVNSFAAYDVAVGWVACNFPVVAGNYYAVVGAKHDAAGVTMYNSYGPATVVSIDGQPTQLNRAGIQGPMTAYTGSTMPDQQIWAYNLINSGSIGRIHMKIGGGGGSGSNVYHWVPSAGLSNSSIANPIATPADSTTYIVYVSDVVNGCIVTDTVNINVLPEIVYSSGSVDATCGQSDGSAYVNVSGGIGPFTYLWSDSLFQTTDTASNLASGSYTATITDSNGCSVSELIAVNEAGAPSVSIAAVVNVSCNGLSDGTATLVATGGTPPYTYQWDDILNQTTDKADSLSPGTYVGTVIGNNGCEASASITITEPTAISMTIFTVDDTCALAAGNASIVASGGTPPLSYEWSDGFSQTTTMATGLVAGSYTVTVTDGNGCTDTLSATVNSFNPMGLTTSSTDANCGHPDGTASVTVSGGTTPINYLWSDTSMQTTDTAWALIPGSYTVIVTDGIGCIDSATVTVNDIPGVTAFITNSIGISCDNNCDGSATATGFGGITPYSYLWNDSLGQTTATANNLCLGTYTITITDAAGCVSSDSVIITNQNAPSLSFSSVTGVSCAGNDGSATVTPLNGAAPYSYQWNDPSNQTNATATGLDVGSYVVEVTDGIGCINSDTIEITSLSSILANIHQDDTVICNGESIALTSEVIEGSNSTILITEMDLTGPDMLEIQNVTNNPVDVSGWRVIVSSSYTVFSSANTIEQVLSGVMNPGEIRYWTDASGTNYWGNNILWNPGAFPTYAGWILLLDDMGNIVDFVASNWDAATIASGSINTLTGTIFPGSAWTGDGWDGTNANTGFSGSRVGTEDKNDLSDFLVQTSTTNVTNPGLTIPFMGPGSGSYVYQWIPATGLSGSNIPNPTATPLDSTTYVLNITDTVTGCVATDSITIHVIPEITFTSGSIDGTCGQADGIAYVNVTDGLGPFSYLWDDPLTQTTDSAVGLASGSYSIDITDGNGCSISEVIAVNDAGAASLSISSSSDVSCNGGADGSATVTATGGAAPLQYLWDDAMAQTNATATGLDAGTYSVIVTDNGNCTSSAVVTINEPSAISATVNSSGASCGVNDGTASITANGGTTPYNYVWDDPTNQTTDTASNLYAGLYHVTITDANGCLLIDSVTVNNPAGPSLSVLAVFDESCAGNDGLASVLVTGGTPPYTYLWDDPMAQATSTALGLNQGNYTLNVTDASGCIASISVTVGGSPPISYPYLHTFDNDTAYNSGSPGTPVIWLLDGWANDQNDGLDWAPRSTATNSSNTGPLADHTSGTGNYIYVEDGFDGDSVNLVGPCMDFTGMCGATLSFWYHSYNGNSPADSSSLHVDILYGGTWNLDVTTPIGPETNEWKQRTVNLSAFVGPVQLRFRVNNNNGTPYHDIAIDDVEVFDGGGVMASTMGTDATCGGGTDGTATITPVGGGAPYTYLWNDPSGQTTATAVGLPAGTYIGTVTDAGGCTASDTVVIGEPTALAYTVTVDTASAGNFDGSATVTVSGGTPPYSYLWSDAASQTTATATGLQAGTYLCDITDANGCIQQAIVTIPEFTSIYGPSSIGGFTIHPNPTDGLFTLDIQLIDEHTFTIQIMDVLGEEVYLKEISGHNKYKDQINLENLPNGVYFLSIRSPKGLANKRIVLTK